MISSQSIPTAFPAGVLKTETLLRANKCQQINNLGFSIMDRWMLNEPDLIREVASVVGVVGHEGDRLLYAAKERQIPELQIDASANWPKADLGLAAHYHQYIAPVILSAFNQGVIGYHPSLMPAYPGKRAIEDAIKAGERKTGGTLYSLNGGWDTGPVIRQVACCIKPGESPGQLWRRALAPIARSCSGIFCHNLGSVENNFKLPHGITPLPGKK